MVDSAWSRSREDGGEGEVEHMDTGVIWIVAVHFVEI